MLFVEFRASRFDEFSKVTRMREMSVNPATSDMPRDLVFKRVQEDDRLARSVEVSNPCSAEEWTEMILDLYHTAPYRNDEMSWSINK